jgi:hypothetical protein
MAISKAIALKVKTCVGWSYHVVSHKNRSCFETVLAAEAVTSAMELTSNPNLAWICEVKRGLKLPSKRMIDPFHSIS